MLKGNRILITGGTGSLGHELVDQLCRDNEIVVYSRNEERQYHMQQKYLDRPVEFYIGDVRDQGTLEMAMRGCQIAIHAAAMKDLIMCESQPTQTYLNNIIGSKSFINAAINSKTEKAVGISTDKAASPSNVYGACKYVMEKLFEEANRHSDTTFFSVRFGNMIDSKGSLIDIWKSDPEQDIKLTHPDVARFFFLAKDASATVMDAIKLAKGGEIFIRKMKKAGILDILRIITGRKEFEIIGLYPGEKLHEDLLGASEVRYSYEVEDYYVIRPGELNPNPPEALNTENAESFTEEELLKLIFPQGK